jgi:hypothetical protein
MWINDKPMTTASETHSYTLWFFGLPDVYFLEDYCPAGTTLTVGENTFTLSNLNADQAGLLGVIRSLLNLGCKPISLL